MSKPSEVNYNEYTVSQEWEDACPCEETQFSSVKWVPLVVNHKDKVLHAPIYPFKCREFYADWQWHCIAGACGEVYDLEFQTKYANVGKAGLTFLGAYSPREAEQEVLSQYTDVVLEMGSDKLFVIPVPEQWWDAPLAISLWIAGIRSNVERKEYAPDPNNRFGFHVEPVKNTKSIVENMHPNLPMGLLCQVLEEDVLFRIQPGTADELEYGTLNYTTHEGMSPCNLAFKFAAGTTEDVLEREKKKKEIIPSCWFVCDQVISIANKLLEANEKDCDKQVA